MNEAHDPDKILMASPIISFSSYTHIQIDVLKRTGSEILAIADNLPNELGHVESGSFIKAYGLFWLWVLGAYEVVRTMDQHKENFTQPLQIRTSEMKRTLAIIRMPFAKQENRGDARPIYAENSVANFDNGLVFEIGGGRYNSSIIIRDFIHYVSGIQSDEILKGIPLSRPAPPD